MLIYDLDKKKLALDLMKLHDYEVAARIFKNKDTPIVNPNFYNDSILNTFDCYHYQTLEYYSCGYSISDTIFTLNCECKIRSSEGDCKIDLSETAKITFNSKFTRIYEIQSDKFVLKIQ